LTISTKQFCAGYGNVRSHETIAHRRKRGKENWQVLCERGESEIYDEARASSAGSDIRPTEIALQLRNGGAETDFEFSGFTLGKDRFGRI
jgi:hypothetical protein